MLRFLLGLSFCIASCGAAMAADPLMGVWLTPEDHKGQVAHVQVRPCQGGYCGQIVAVWRGQDPVDHHNLGKDLFTDMRPIGGGTYEGLGWVPVHNIQVRGKAQVTGNQLTFRGCVLGICQNQIWIRLK